MTIEDFAKTVKDRHDLWLGSVDGDDGVTVTYGPHNVHYKVGIQAILENDWPTLESVLTGKREPLALRHMTRVVGYFSQVENWNKSKVGELKDRHKGNYGIAETENIPQKVVDNTLGEVL